MADQQTLPPTFHADPSSAESDDSGDEQPACEVWGRLFSERPEYPSVELIEDTYKFGRHESCQIIFADKCISNIHCTIIRENPQEAQSQYADGEMLAFLIDQSANGTFVNNERLGKGRKVALAHGDKISLLNKKHTPSYIFHDCSQENNDPHAALREKYNLKEQLGSGACGEVHLGLDKSTGRKYAIKIISKKRFSQTSSMGAPSNDQLLVEVDILLRLQHPNIIHVHDMIDTPKYLYIVLEFAQGGELFDRIVKKEGFSEEEARYIFMQLLDAVEYLHQQGVAHRDLKPENILLASDADDALVKVTDFGLAKLVGPQSFMKTMCGTPSYQAPEVLDPEMHNHEGYSFAVDMWSLGVILYIFLVGYPPFSDQLPTPLSKQIREGLYEMPDEYWKLISEDAKDLVRKLLVVDPAKRLTVRQAAEHPFMQHEETRRRVIAKQEEFARRRKRVDTQTSVLKRRADGMSNTDAKRSNSSSTAPLMDSTGNSSM
eukprot:m.255095 g.255095  ORF g.255095 m.255095 type:complete len:489 (-) comp19073_c1_seq1:167-1633(-)